MHREPAQARAVPDHSHRAEGSQRPRRTSDFRTQFSRRAMWIRCHMGDVMSCMQHTVRHHEHQGQPACTHLPGNAQGPGAAAPCRHPPWRRCPGTTQAAALQNVPPASSASHQRSGSGSSTTGGPHQLSTYLGGQITWAGPDQSGMPGGAACFPPPGEVHRRRPWRLNAVTVAPAAPRTG